VEWVAFEKRQLFRLIAPIQFGTFVPCDILDPSLRWDDGGLIKTSVIPAQAGIQNAAPYS
jgi:hypothetical protein